MDMRGGHCAEILLVPFYHLLSMSLTKAHFVSLPSNGVGKELQCISHNGMQAVYNSISVPGVNRQHSSVNVYCPECPPGGTIGHPGGQQKIFLPFSHRRDLATFTGTGLQNKSFQDRAEISKA